MFVILTIIMDPSLDGTEHLLELLLKEMTPASTFTTAN